MEGGPIKKRRNIYMGQEYLDMEAIAVNERRRTGRDISVADIIRLACRDYKDRYWKGLISEARSEARRSHSRREIPAADASEPATSVPPLTP